jgi:excinuclease ABC subunit B
MAHPRFQLSSSYQPAGDQPVAINQLVASLQQGDQAVTLLGATGTGKTFTAAHVIERLQRPALILAHNKTLAGQLYNEFKGFFPNNAVEYFISYYDFYQPEAYIPRTDTYIEKTATINDDIDRMRHRATKSLFERQDVIVIASVSCIYGLGMPDVYLNAAIRFRVGDDYPRQALLHQLVRNQYPRQDVELKRASFRLRGDIIDVHPADEERVLRLEFFDTTLESMSLIDPTSGEVLDAVEEYVLYPAVHHVTEEGQVEDAIATIKAELKERLAELDAMGKHLEAERLKQRTFRDITMIKELGYCNGIENYSRIFDGRAPGTPPRTLIDYFPRDFLLFVDESHVTVPQLRGMYHGDRSRKDTLVEYGFRLPCARDNRPLTFDEFYARVGQRIYISATPSKFELEESPVVVEQIIRPTGLIDPTVTVIPTQGQVEHMLGEIQKTIDQSQRVIITTLTKRMAEDLTEFLNGHNVRVRYLHSDIKSLERIEIIRDLRLGEFDVLVGVNLLREGLDLPEVSLVAIMDADKEGFLRSDSALIQTIGRAARNAAGRVLLYADKITDSMARAMDETERRRAKQLVHNKKHNITPLTIYKPLSNGLLDALGFEVSGVPGAGKTAADALAEAKAMPKHDLAVLIEQLNDEMKAAAGMLEFEKAAKLRDQIKTLQGLLPVAS